MVMRPPGTAAALEKRRRKAVELLQQKIPIVEVAEVVKASTSSVKRWRDAFAAQGQEGLNSTPPPKRPSRLTEKQQQRLIRTLLRGARASGYPNDLWTCPRVLEVIQTLFGVTYHVDYVGTLLHKLGWSVQKPEQRAREQDEAEIQRWRRENWPRIKKGAGSKS
jgi:transposase